MIQIGTTTEGVGLWEKNSQKTSVCVEWLRYICHETLNHVLYTLGKKRVTSRRYMGNVLD